MRTTIDLDDELVAAVVEESGQRSKKAAIETGLREFIKGRQRKRLIEMIGSEEFAIDMTLDDLRKMRGKG